MKEKSVFWGIVSLLICVTVVVFAVSYKWRPSEIIIENPIVVVTSTLFTLLIVATLLERSVSVTFRILTNRTTAKEREIYRDRLTAAKASARHFGVADSKNVESVKLARKQLVEEADSQNWIRNCILFLASIIVAASGVQILGNFLATPNSASQAYLFNGIDIFLSAGLLAGGSSGIAEIIKYFNDFRDQAASDKLAEEYVLRATGKLTPPERATLSSMTMRGAGPDLSWLSDGNEIQSNSWEISAAVGPQHHSPVMKSPGIALEPSDDSAAYLETDASSITGLSTQSQAAWRVAHSLDRLRSQINDRFPSRSKASDGTIGDIHHCPGKSDHCPNANDVVTAFDCTHDPQNGCDMGEVTDQLRLSQDSRIKYVIYDHRIFSSYPWNGTEPWTWRPYSGSNPHTKHAHISVIGDPAKYDDQSEWVLETFKVEEEGGCKCRQ